MGDAIVLDSHPGHSNTCNRPLKVGIVGGGIAGLYTALYLQQKGHHVHIFEGTDRIGGRVHTHYFTPDRDQYYEAGAMRIPKTDFQDIFFDLVKYINKPLLPEKRINLIKYVLSTDKNLVFVNGSLRPETTASNTTPAMIGWPDIDEKHKDMTAGALLKEALGRLMKKIAPPADFEPAFKKKIVDKWDNFTFRYYCIKKCRWTNSLVDFVETMTSQTNQFNLSVPELVMQSLDFGVKEWQTIDGGMSRLPELMAQRVGLENVTFGARVTGVKPLCKDCGENSPVKIITTGYNGTLEAVFDRVVLAIPPAALRMIVDRPRWSVKKEVAIRALHFEPLYKMGLRFKTRFWEHVDPPSFGGQSTTDLPIRWIVYPSNGIPVEDEAHGQEHDQSGVLLVYSWMTDATNWLPLTPLERRNVALNCLAQVYNGKKDRQGNNINVYNLLIESADHVWSSSTATGDAMFLPGQFKEHFEVAREHEGRIYFAGEHLSFHHTWIAGAALSALKVVEDIIGVKDLRPLSDDTPTHVGFGDQPIDLSFKFQPYNPMYSGTQSPSSPFSEYMPVDVSRDWPPKGCKHLPDNNNRGDGDEKGDNIEKNDGVEQDKASKKEAKAPPQVTLQTKLPNYLGMLDKSALGVVCSKNTSYYAVGSWDMGRVGFR